MTDIRPFRSAMPDFTSAETYILKPWILLGGNDNIENYSIGNLNVYLDLVSKAQNK